MVVSTKYQKPERERSGKTGSFAKGKLECRSLPFLIMVQLALENKRKGSFSSRSSVSEIFNRILTLVNSHFRGTIII